MRIHCHSAIGGTGSNVYKYTLNKTTGVVQSGNKFTFNDAGNYLATLTVSDLSGEAASNSVLITVTPKLTTSLTLSVTR